MKQKYNQAIDELTKIKFELDKALKDQMLMFQEQRIKEYNDKYEQKRKALKELEKQMQ